MGNSSAWLRWTSSGTGGGTGLGLLGSPAPLSWTGGGTTEARLGGGRRGLILFACSISASRHSISSFMALKSSFSVSMSSSAIFIFSFSAS